MELKIFIRQNQIYNINGQQIYYAGTGPFNLVETLGQLTANRQFPNFGNWIDVTDNVSDLTDLELSWSISRDNTGDFRPENQVKKATSGQLTFELYAYELIKKWLIEDVSASLNSIEVMIQDTTCGEFRGYIFGVNDIDWCEDGLCQYSVTLRQQDELISCLRRTIISDNWQGWFPENGIPANGKKHPRFRYCNEMRPNATLILQWYLILAMFSTFGQFVIMLAPIINSIIFTINVIIAVINALGGNVQYMQYINFGELLEGISSLMVESAGCGREHPAPLVRDYMTNVCDKCGVVVNAQTAPIFFSQTLDVETSTGFESIDNEYYNLCYFNAPVKRGIRAFRRMNLLIGFFDPANQYWIDANRPVINIFTLLDQVCGLLNHEHRVVNGQLVISRKDEMYRHAPLYDFREGSIDRDKLVKGLCFEPTQAKHPASAMGVYQPDGSDLCGNEAGNANGTGQMNGLVSFVATNPNVFNKSVNPNFEGILNKTSAFGATRFRLDGVSDDYIMDALQIVMNGGFFTFLTGAPGAQTMWYSAINAALDAFKQYADHALLLQSETAVLPKLLIWDGVTYENARAVKLKAAYPGVSNLPTPDINSSYNEMNQTWDTLHFPETDVRGKGLTFPGSPNGVYRFSDYFGIILEDRPAILINYPLYFEPNFKGTLWDRFHWIDDPNRARRMNYKWSCRIELCCEDLKKLGLLNMATDVALGERVRLPFGPNEMGTITEITVSYKSDSETGRYIELKGTL